LENILSGLLDTVLRGGEKSTKTNRKYFCPFTDCNSSRNGNKRLEVDIVTDSEGQNKWHCWACNASGKKVRSLLRRMGASREVVDKLDKLIVRTDLNEADYKVFDGLLPAEYVFLPEAKSSDILAKHARVYLKRRGITSEDIVKYQIGYCDDGPYAERIIIPSYDCNGKMNFFVGRSFDETTWLKYKYPQVSRDIVFNEMNINWDAPIVLCEGVFDMFSIKRNAIPLLGKSITQNLMKKLINSKVKKLYIALDPDAIKMALKHCETFITYGKQVYLVDLKGYKDPGEMGFENFTNNIHTAEKLSLTKIMQLKLSL